MQKQLYLLLFIFLFVRATVTLAQIPNPGFETWSNGSPAGWSNVYP
jgi:hypothetical protein